MKQLAFSIIFLPFFISCTERAPATEVTTEPIAIPEKEAKDTVVKAAEKADAATILERKQVPVLCYHNLRSYKPNESSSSRVYTVPVEVFKEHIKYLHDSGYQTITPQEYYDYLTVGASLPPKPVMITFDDTDVEHYTVGASELEKYGFKGVFFIMTIAIGKPDYLSKEQIKSLADMGHVVASHTWDHNNVKSYNEKDYEVQFAGSKKTLEDITGKPVDFFAYPFGAWNEAAIPELQKAGYKAAFQLAQNKRDSIEPVYSLRRMIVPGNWSPQKMEQWMKTNFK